MGVDLDSYRGWERGRVQPEAPSWKRVIDFLGYYPGPTPSTLGEHLIRRRRELGLLQREAASRIGIAVETYQGWETDRIKPFPTSWKLIVQFLGYDPVPSSDTLADRLKAKRRELGLSKERLAKQLGWSTRRVSRYERGECMPSGKGLEQLIAFLDGSPFEGQLSDGLRTRCARREPFRL